jgi:hypothetical protein
VAELRIGTAARYHFGSPLNRVQASTRIRLGPPQYGCNREIVYSFVKKLTRSSLKC